MVGSVVDEIDVWVSMSLMDRCRWIHSTIIREPIICNEGKWREVERTLAQLTGNLEFFCEKCHGRYQISQQTVSYRYMYGEWPPRVHARQVPNYAANEQEGKNLFRRVFYRGEKDTWRDLFLAYLMQQRLPTEEESVPGLLQLLKMVTGFKTETIWGYLNLTPEQVCTAAYETYKVIQMQREREYPDIQQLYYHRLRHMQSDDGVPLFARIGAVPEDVLPDCDYPYLLFSPSVSALYPHGELLFPFYPYTPYYNEKNDQALLSTLADQYHWRVESLTVSPYPSGQGMYRRVGWVADWI